MIERVPVDHEFPKHLEEWRNLWLREKWQLTVLLIPPGREEAIAFGCKPAPAKRPGGRRN